MNVLLISNDYNFSDSLSQKLRSFDVKTISNINSYDSISLLKRNSSNYDIVLIDDEVNDYSLSSIIDMIRMEDSSIPIILLCTGKNWSWEKIKKASNANIIQDCGSRGDTHAEIEDLGPAIQRVYKQSKMYR